MRPRTIRTDKQVDFGRKGVRMKKQASSPKAGRDNGFAEKSFCEFFAGIGLVRDGLSGSGWKCVFANDIDPKKRELYEGHFGSGDHFHLGDVWETREIVSRIPGQPFLATASFPCIDLSLAGHWRGFEGDHSSTFFGCASALAGLGCRRPKLVMLENVTGFITSREGKDFAAAAQALAELGYWLDAIVVDAKYFVPQSRPRIFVVGVHESIETPLVTRQSSTCGFFDHWTSIVERGPESLRPPKLVALMKRTELPTGWAAFQLPPLTQQRVDLATVIDVDDAQDWWDEGAVKKHYDMMSDLHRPQVDEMIESGGTFVGTIYRRKRYGKTRAEIRFDGIAGCLRTPRGGSARQIVIVISRGRLRMRWMSAREYARLQGAKDFTLVGNNNQNLFGFGDAVCVPVIQWLDQNILTPVFDSVAKKGKQGYPRGRQPNARTTPQNYAGSKGTQHFA
jgi:DNA (cytosine-5)-methyltransferase 1